MGSSVLYDCQDQGEHGIRDQHEEYIISDSLCTCTVKVKQTKCCHNHHCTELHHKTGDKIYGNRAQDPMPGKKLSHADAEIDHEHGADISDQAENKNIQCKSAERHAKYFCHFGGNKPVDMIKMGATRVFGRNVKIQAVHIKKTPGSAYKQDDRDYAQALGGETFC